MKKKEVLIIFLLAVLVTGLTLLWRKEGVWTTAGVEKREGNYLYGFPVSYWETGIFERSKQALKELTPGEIPFAFGLLALVVIGGFVVDVLFWFLVLAAGWWAVKRVKR